MQNTGTVVCELGVGSWEYQKYQVTAWLFNNHPYCNMSYSGVPWVMIDIVDLPRAVHSSISDSFPTFLIVTAGGWIEQFTLLWMWWWVVRRVWIHRSYDDFVDILCTLGRDTDLWHTQHIVWNRNFGMFSNADPHPRYHHHLLVYCYVAYWRSRHHLEWSLYVPGLVDSVCHGGCSTEN